MTVAMPYIISILMVPMFIHAWLQFSDAINEYKNGKIRNKIDFIPDIISFLCKIILYIFIIMMFFSLRNQVLSQTRC